MIVYEIVMIKLMIALFLNYKCNRLNDRSNFSKLVKNDTSGVVAEQTNLREEELLQGLKEGSRSAFEEIFKRYWYPLYKTVYNQTKAHDEAEEIVQELFSVIWEKRDSLVIHNLSNYLFTSARRRVLNHFRSGKVRDRYVDYYLHLNSFIEENAETALNYSELTETVQKVLKRLPEKTQQVFKLNRIEGYSISEISENLKLPKRTIGYHLTKSLKEFQLHLKDFITLLIFLLFC